MNSQTTETNNAMNLQAEFCEFRDRVEALTAQVVELSEEVAQLKQAREGHLPANDDLIEWYRSAEFVSDLSHGMTAAAREAISDSRAQSTATDG